jgi:hypothetical protein
MGQRFNTFLIAITFALPVYAQAPQTIAPSHLLQFKQDVRLPERAAFAEASPRLADLRRGLMK